MDDNSLLNSITDHRHILCDGSQSRVANASFAEPPMAS